MFTLKLRSHYPTQYEVLGKFFSLKEAELEIEYHRNDRDHPPELEDYKIEKVNDDQR